MPSLAINWYITVLTKRFALFEGRAGREEFLSFILVNWAVLFVLGFVLGLLGRMTGLGVLSMLALLAFLATAVPSVAVFIRRLHDTGRPAIYALLLLVPLINLLAVIYFGAMLPGASGSNVYGDSPKGEAPRPKSPVPA